MRLRLIWNRWIEQESIPLAFSFILIGSFLGIVSLVMLLMAWGMASAAMRDLGDAIAPLRQDELAEDRIYAYREWQSVGIRVSKSDWVDIRASGKWLYTPDEYHGPEGHPRFPAPRFYPVSGRGGTLIGRVGEQGRPFYVGRYNSFSAQNEGMLYFRINDDMLSDNDGYVVVEVDVIEAEDRDEG